MIGFWRGRNDYHAYAHHTSIYWRNRELFRGTIEVPALCLIGLHRWAKPPGYSVGRASPPTHHYRCARLGCDAKKEVPA